MTKTTRIAIAAAMMVSAIALAAQNGVVLKRTLSANAKETYKVEGSMKTTVVSPMGPQDISAETVVKYDLSMGAVDEAAGTAEATTVLTVEKLVMTGMFNDDGTNLPEPVTFKGKLDKTGRLILDKDATQGDVMQAVLSGSDNTAMTGLFVQLPEKAVKTGDVWSVNVPASSLSAKEQTLEAKLIGEKEVEGVKTLEVSVTGTLQTEVANGTLPASAGPVAGQPFTLKGTIEVKGTAFVNPINGQTVQYDNELTGKQVISLTTLGIDVDATSSVKTKATLQK